MQVIPHPFKIHKDFLASESFLILINFNRNATPCACIEIVEPCNDESKNKTTNRIYKKKHQNFQNLKMRNSANASLSSTKKSV